MWFRLLTNCRSHSTMWHISLRLVVDFYAILMDLVCQIKTTAPLIPAYAMKSRAIQNALKHLHNSSSNVRARVVIAVGFVFCLLCVCVCFSSGFGSFFFFISHPLFVSCSRWNDKEMFNGMERHIKTNKKYQLLVLLPLKWSRNQSEKNAVSNSAFLAVFTLNDSLFLFCSSCAIPFDSISWLKCIGMKRLHCRHFCNATSIFSCVKKAKTAKWMLFTIHRHIVSSAQWKFLITWPFQSSKSIRFNC